MEYYSTVKKNKATKYPGKWMELEKKILLRLPRERKINFSLISGSSL